MASTAFCPPDGRMNSDCSTGVDLVIPSWSSVRQQVKMDQFSATTGTGHNAAPDMLMGAHKVKCPCHQFLWNIIDSGCPVGKRPLCPKKPSRYSSPNGRYPIHNSILSAPNMGRSRSGDTSPRPTCRMSDSHGSPSHSLYTRPLTRLNLWLA